MHYYIDGYNLLFRILRPGADLRKQREEITLQIEKKVNLLQLDVTLVFDSHYQEDGNTRSHFNSIEIVFTATGETADEFILQELKESQSPFEHTIITSDKKLARLCQLRLGKTESVEEFLAWLSKRYKNKLRQKKQLANPPLPKPSGKVPELPPISLPTPLDSPQNCFDYYLNIFEKVSNEFEPQKKEPKTTSKKPKKIKVIKHVLTKEEEHLSHFERWQKAFEKGETDPLDQL